jgi:cytochrome b
MTIGAALFTITVGAILAFAVTAEFGGIDVQIVGYILLAVGALGLVFGLWQNSSRSRAAGPPPGY